MRENAIIPIVPTSFIGRGRETGELARLLASSRLVTLTGSAGCGKTRLALRVAQEVSDRFPTASTLELAPLADPTLLPQTLAKGLRLKEQPEQPLLQTIIDALYDKQLLLILDNCEHLRTACTQLVTTLLAETPITILATSREPLSVTGERLYPVPSLSLPPRNHHLDDLTNITHYEAIELFIERAQAVLPSFALTADNADTIINICRQLEGLPLAIELAAARVNVLAVEQIAARLDNHFTLLAPANHITHSPHHTLQAAIDWSHDLLTESEQLLLRRLSVFSGGCSLTSAEMVCAGEGIEREQMLDLLASLVNKSLVSAVTLHRSEARYALLETIRQYGREKLQTANEWTQVRDRHLQCFLRLAEETEPKLRGEYQQLWLNWLGDEYDNIRAALRWSLKSGQIAQGLRIAIAIYEFWTIRDYTEEALAWLEQFLARADEGVPLVVRANALAYATFLAGFRGNRVVQAAYGREAADLAEALGAEGQSVLAWARAGEAYALGRPGPLPFGGSAAAWALGTQAYSARAEGDYETEFAIYKKVIHLHREKGERHLLGPSLITASFAALSLGKYKEARAMGDEGLPLLREAGNPYWIAMTLNGSGDLARCEGNYTRAQSDYEESITLLREIGAERDLASALHNLGYVCLRLGDVEHALTLFSESIALQYGQQNKPGLAECLIGFAAVAVVCGLPAACARLLAAAVAIGGEPVATTWPATKMEYEHYHELTRASLTEQEFRTEQAAGRTLSLEQAVAYAHNLPFKTAPQSTRRKPDDLTPREREVAALVAQAKSNDEIAEELVLSKRTVEKHISNIRSKLGFTERTQIVRWAIEIGLVDSTE